MEDNGKPPRNSNFVGLFVWVAIAAFAALYGKDLVDSGNSWAIPVGIGLIFWFTYLGTKD